ncbi:MAG: rod shape-determining protein MreD [Candidatus Coatesbacteria bacterium]|nr:rod shape-determining protein MreD [Candidatus Coatesbacteria bacterium]
MAKTSETLYRVLAYTVMLLGAITLQTTILHFAPFQMIIVDFGLIAVVWIGLSRGSGAALVVGFLMGLIEDSLSGCALGTNALIKTMVGALSGTMGGWVLPNSPVAHLLSLAVCSLLNHILLYLLLLLTASSRLSAGGFAMHMVAGTLTTTVLGMLVFRILSRIKALKPSRVPEEVVEREWTDAD